MCEDKYEEFITFRRLKFGKQDVYKDEQKENRKKKQKVLFIIKMEFVFVKFYYLIDILLFYGKDERLKVRWSGCLVVILVIQSGEKFEYGNGIFSVVEEDEEIKSDVYMFRFFILENKFD